MTQENRYVEMAKKIENRYLNCDGEDLPVHVKCNCLIHMITEALESVARERDAEIEKFYTGCKPTLLQKLHDLEKREHISGCYEIYGDCTCKDLHEKITQDLKQESLTHLKYLSDANKQLSEKEAEIIKLQDYMSHCSDCQKIASLEAEIEKFKLAYLHEKELCVRVQEKRDSLSQKLEKAINLIKRWRNRVDYDWDSQFEEVLKELADGEIK